MHMKKCDAKIFCEDAIAKKCIWGKVYANYRDTHVNINGFSPGANEPFLAFLDVKLKFNIWNMRYEQ